MRYGVKYSDRAVKALQKMDRPIAAMLYAWISKNLEGCSNPRASGKALAGDKKGMWRYRVGDYRIIAVIDDGQVTINLIHIAHRRDAYAQ